MVNRLKFIDENRGEIISTLQNLIRAKTVNPPGDVTEGINVIRKILDDYGVEYKIIEPVKGKKNLIARVGDENGKKLILNGHIDVVPEGKKWDSDPFSGKIVGDKIIGRGSSDMKGGVVALLYSFLANRQRSNGSILLTLVADEETGGKYGIRYLIENGFIEGDACIVGEPTGSTVHGRYSIVAGEKGNLWLKIVSHGKPFHGSMPMLGVNAVRKMSDLIQRLPEVYPKEILFPEDAMELIDNGRKWLDFINKGAGMAVDHLTINVGTIKGGSKINMVADSCEIELDVRVPIGFTVDQAFSEIENYIGEGYDVELIEKTDPSYTALNEEIIKITREVGIRFLNYDPPPITMPATSDARFFRFAGIPTVNFGPGFLELAHTEREYTIIQDVIDFAKMYTVIINDYLKND